MEEWGFGRWSVRAKGAEGSGNLGRVETESKERALGSRAPRFIKASRTLHLSWQVGVFLVGLAIVFAGVLMLALPGPGWLVIFTGLAVWATEFVWAQIVLRWTRRKVSEAARRALDPKVRRRNMTLTALGVTVAAVLVGLYLARYGLAMPWDVAG
ncbi:TIGR02611 family protein [Streptomyces verrucosisporus]|uniref:TIGR02611 family protein n=1 Tax=Streptomyces verrucosisporus TaxID=1695161 RepID=UPI0019CF8A6A|nr:TIGR02611 family protein [Streptomyces verrucosisporus]MBN3932700.1 TIGR02611 family protein [Streptomyces verrucosisporus]